ncbi:hypothetical protein [Streptomyces pristinaespiralis]|uniref:hypothetical protein n=1 Tax=Streptomyces pristinaespiralis TaxID=38300 RepID=UPI00384F0FD8
MAAAAAPAVAAGPAAAPYPICYGAEASVMNKYGQNAAYGKTGWCLDDRGYFETTTGWNSIKDLVNGDGVAARIWLWGEYQDGTQFKFARATDYTTTSGATTWGFSGYLDHMSIHVCLGSAQPGTGSAYCEEMSPTIRYPW